MMPDAELVVSAYAAADGAAAAAAAVVLVTDWNVLRAPISNGWRRRLRSRRLSTGATSIRPGTWRKRGCAANSRVGRREPEPAKPLRLRLVHRAERRRAR